MDTVLEDATTIERCQNCHGLYFDQLTRSLLPVVMGSVDVDTGTEEPGAGYDDMVYVESPRCDRMMDQRLIEEPVRIRFELCPSCNATFLMPVSSGSTRRKALSGISRHYYRNSVTRDQGKTGGRALAAPAVHYGRLLSGLRLAATSWQL